MNGDVLFFVLIAWAVVAWLGLVLVIAPHVTRLIDRAERRAIERIDARRAASSVPVSAQPKGET